MKTRIRTDELMQPIATFSHATQAGGMIHLGATAGTDSQRRLAGVRPGLCDVEIQIEKMLANVDFVLSKLGAHKNQLIRFKTYVTDVRDFQICESMVKQWLQGIDVDTVFVGTIGFPLPQAQVEVDAVAQLGKDSKLVYLSVLDQSQEQSMNAHSSIERFNHFFLMTVCCINHKYICSCCNKLRCFICNIAINSNCGSNSKLALRINCR